MAINTSKQFATGIKTLGNKTAQTRKLIQELLIASVFFAERDGDVSPIQRVVDAVGETKSYDMWKIHAWLKHYEAPIKPSEDGKTYVFDAKKRHLEQGASREDFLPYETVMRTEAAWYELAKKEATPSDVWDVESKFDSFMKTLTKHGYVDAADAVAVALKKVKKEGKLKTITEQVIAETEQAPV